MTLAQECINIITDLNRFEPEMLYEQGDSPNHVYPHINKLSPYQWKNRVRNSINLLEDKLVKLVVRPNTAKVKKDFSSIYRSFSQMRRNIDLSQYPYVERLDENGNHVDYYTFENYEFNSCGSFYNRVQSKLETMLQDIAEGYNLYIKGIKIKTTYDRIRAMYKEFEENGLVERGVEDAFVNSLTGKPIIDHVRWKNKSTLSLFIRALDECSIPASIIRNEKIHWKEVTPVFPYDITGKDITSDLKGSSKYEGLRYNNIKDIVEKLKLPPT